MLLQTLADQVVPIPVEAAAIDIRSLSSDSRNVSPGCLFAALAGTKTDGAAYATKAVAAGAVAVLAGLDTAIGDLGVPVLRSADPRRALALIAARLYGPQPAIAVAVTGTNGKTSVAEFTRQIFASLGHKAASLGTIGIVKPGGAVYGSLTTPDPITLHKTLAGLAGEGITHVAFEASSHGLDQRRLDGVVLKAAAFTNLGRDHLDYHPTVDEYFKAKLRLFDTLLPTDGVAVVHADDEMSRQVVEVARKRGVRVITTGRVGTNLNLLHVERTGFSQLLSIWHAGKRYEIALALIGEYQATNALLAAGLAIAAGADAGAAIAAIETLKGVNGRLDIVGEHNGGLAVVDYAHKPEALEAALGAVRPFATGKLICVFGCGGDRDKGKRPIMGRIAADNADVVIVTDDNPRSETAATVRAEILALAPGAIEIGDRTAAIARGVSLLGPGDVLLVAGKGHETGQIVGSTVLPFSDHDALRAAMTPPLWTTGALLAAAHGSLDGTIDQSITGFSIDTRSLMRGDVFVALKDARDGHDFVPAAFRAGATAAIVSETYVRHPGDGALIRVDDPLRALERIGAAARARLSPDARVIAVTGSVGKTGTKEMLRACLGRVGKTHAAVKSFNNHWGVPLTLARTPADVAFAVYEIGMNHAGEITPLTKLVRPHVAIVTTVEPVHLANFASIEGIADAKAEIFVGLEPGGTAVIPGDNDYGERLTAAALANGANILTFGYGLRASIRRDVWKSNSNGSDVQVRVGNNHLHYFVSVPGEHIMSNSCAVVAALHAAGVTQLPLALAALANLTAPEGRGARFERKTPEGPLLLIDESYNANPASMRAALGALGTVPRDRFRRRIAALGDMLELGAAGADLHRGLSDAVAVAGIDRIYCCGPQMRHLFDTVPAAIQGAWAPDSAALLPLLLADLGDGDAVMIKGSLGSRMAPLVQAVKDRFPGDE